MGLEKKMVLSCDNPKCRFSIVLKDEEHEPVQGYHMDILVVTGFGGGGIKVFAHSPACIRPAVLRKEREMWDG